MDLNHYAVEVLARDRLAERRQAATRHTLVRTAARPRAVIRVVVGRALIRLGTRALGRGLAPAEMLVVETRRTG
jgi:hypothetical protein